MGFSIGDIKNLAPRGRIGGHFINISIDAHGGDFGLPVTIQGGLRALTDFQDLFIYFVGDKSAIENELKKLNVGESIINRIDIIQTTEVVGMDEAPAAALRKKKDSSMRVAINLVKNGTSDGCVSAGNTGALMAISRFVLKTIKGIGRPAIMGKLPTKDGHTHMLDLGANIDSNPENLLEYAVMGSVAVEKIDGIQNPSVGLLNIGVEDIKGNEKIKKTADLLKTSGLNYVGFIEGDDIFKGKVDLVACDGLEGNIAIKAAEGVLVMMSHHLRKSFTKNIISKSIALVAKSVLKDFKSGLSPSKYNGASLLGLRGVVVKSHGGSDIEGFHNAIGIAYMESKADIISKISGVVQSELGISKEKATKIKFTNRELL